ncbi:hypothetical protein Ahy_B01g051762 isoform H [Arachis hypogaea]|uniref:Uncharacterized protein n=1 Tax=Arachis hypogaea TaxID=3818 RepID=A0A445AMU7_ARAHY|nr:hypothetical protein Ahy_B01g051762 isoform H [Arachis hypogaea]
MAGRHACMHGFRLPYQQYHHHHHQLGFAGTQHHDDVYGEKEKENDCDDSGLLVSGKAIDQ